MGAVKLHEGQGRGLPGVGKGTSLHCRGCAGSLLGLVSMVEERDWAVMRPQ